MSAAADSASVLLLVFSFCLNDVAWMVPLPRVIVVPVWMSEWTAKAATGQLLSSLLLALSGGAWCSEDELAIK